MYSDIETSHLIPVQLHDILTDTVSNCGKKKSPKEMTTL